MILRDVRGDVPATRTADGWEIDAEREWLVEGEPVALAVVAAALGSVCQQLAPGLVLLSFGNAIGRYQAGPLGVLRVRSGKWDEAHYALMLSDIAATAASLPFQAGAASALPYSRTEANADDVLYHAFVWLRHAVLERRDAPLVGALRAIVRDPHRLMMRRDRVVPIEAATRISLRALDEIASGVRPLRRVSRGRGLAGGDLFPTEVSERVPYASTDTAENRFVKAFLASCVHVVEAMRQRLGASESGLAVRVGHDCAAIEGELTPIQCHRMWEGVGPMRLFPASSTVLQRRFEYREVLRHHMLMRMASKALPLDHEEVVQLLEVKNIARLYELWTAFQVIDGVRGWLGEPSNARRVADDALSARLGAGLVAEWPDGTAVAYNASYSASGGFHGRSWSLTLRPDVALWVPGGESAGLHLFDAKFRLQGSISGEQEAESVGAKTDDVHKMHTYRDAIPAARSAWVLYPGTVLTSWSCAESGGAGVEGVGAIPVVPGERGAALHEFVGRVLGGAGLAEVVGRAGTL